MASLRARGIYANVFNPHKDDLSGLSNICDVEADSLWSIAFPAITFSGSRVMKQVKVLGHLIPINVLKRHQVQLCPICLHSEPYYRFVWELSVVSACPFHNCLLIDRCPQCQLQIQWSRPKVALCSCQFDWRYFQPKVINSEQITLSQHIYKLCHLTGFPLADKFSISSDNPVSQLNLASLVNLLVSLLKLGRLTGIKHQVFPSPKTSVELSTKLTTEFERVFDLLKDWPNNFYPLMDRYEAYLDYVAQGGYVSSRMFLDIMDFFVSVFRWFSEDSWGFIQEVFTESFERLLKKMSIKKIQISFYKNYRFYSVDISLKTKIPLIQLLGSRRELRGVTLAQLFALSKIDMYDETLFFRMSYLLDYF